MTQEVDNKIEKFCSSRRKICVKVDTYHWNNLLPSTSKLNMKIYDVL